MSEIHSTVTELPLSCKSAVEHMARELEFEDIYADLPESCCQKLTDLEELLSQETGDKIALVAYRL